MKRILITVFVTSILCLVGCGGESDSSYYQSSNTTDSTKDKKITESSDKCRTTGKSALYIKKGYSCKFTAKGLLNNNEQTISCSTDGVIQLNDGKKVTGGSLYLDGYTFKCD